MSRDVLSLSPYDFVTNAGTTLDITRICFNAGETAVVLKTVTVGHLDSASVTSKYFDTLCRVTVWCVSCMLVVLSE